MKFFILVQENFNFELKLRKFYAVNIIISNFDVNRLQQILSLRGESNDFC